MIFRETLVRGGRALGRSGLRAWLRTGKALGYQCLAVERLGANLGEPDRIVGRLPNGCRVRCDLLDEVQRWIWYYGAYEPIEAYLFTRLIRPGMTVVDAGANAGQYTMLASTAVGEAGSVHSFEPIPATFDRLSGSVADNGLANVHLNRAALWHEEATLRFALPAGQASNSGSYSVGAVGAGESGVEARAVRLDAYVEERGLDRVDLIKMDIEGAEPFALAGARATLARSRPTILMEINAEALHDAGASPATIWEELSPLGYRAWKIGDTKGSSGPLPDPAGVRRANLIFHQADLPPDVTEGWTLHSVLGWARSGW